jgi:septal ring factor EnvC (AmiA/AmiB activator)
MKLKNTNILILSLLAMTFPYVAAAETDCFHETQSLLSIILCLDQKGIDNTKAITKAVDKHNSEIKTLNDKLRQVTDFAQKQSEEIVVLKKQSSNLKQQLVDLNQALKELKAQVVHFRQPFELDSFRVKAIKLK